MKPADPNWRERWADRLVSIDEAVKLVKSGDSVYTGGVTSVPVQLCAALAARRNELRDVSVCTFLSPYRWDQPENYEAFRLTSVYAGPHERGGVREGRMDFIPVSQWRDGVPPPGLERFSDVSLIPISAPDEDGWCSFGAGVWFGPTMAAISRTLIGEVHPEFIRTGGNNRIHITRFERVAEAGAPAPPPPIPPRSGETELAAQVICTLVAAELVKDGATLQFGIGDVSAALPVFLDEKHDLGVHTELLPGGITGLVERGIITNRYKALHPGKVVASGVAQVGADELAYMDRNPVFEFYDFTYTDDLRVLLQIENFLAINNALAVDLTGNVSSESMGASIFSGTGGQPAFAVGASTAAGGSVIVLPSSQLVGDVRHSRIVAQHPPGTLVTVQRAFVDYVVTEEGIASLRGKTVRERCDELISVAHPDFRAELRRQAGQLHNL